MKILIVDDDGFAVLEALRADVSERFLLILVLTAHITEDAKARALDRWRHWFPGQVCQPSGSAVANSQFAGNSTF